MSAPDALPVPIRAERGPLFARRVAGRDPVIVGGGPALLASPSRRALATVPSRLPLLPRADEPPS